MGWSKKPSRRTELNFDGEQKPEKHPERDPARMAALTLNEFIPQASPGLVSPTWLQPMTDSIMNAFNPPNRSRVVHAVPCQHGKSTVIFHAIPLLLLKYPKKFFFYGTYGQTFSGRNSRKMRRIAVNAGVQLDPEHNTIQEWLTTDGGGLLATSVDGEGTGRPCDGCFIDDPYKNREDAENPEYRAKVEDWIEGVIIPRLSPGAPVFITASRWVENDASGWAIKEKGFREVRIPAINDDGSDPTRAIGEALCPNGPDPEAPRNLEFLEGLRKDVGEYNWESLYQGRPRPRQGAIFRDATFYSELPEGGQVVCLGFDIAHSVGARSDFTVIVRAVRILVNGVPHFYITNVLKWRKSTADSEGAIRASMAADPGAKLVIYASGAERGLVNSFGMLKPPIHLTVLPAWSSKYVRAQPTAKLWNENRILLPHGAPWLSDFLSVVCGFTGEDKNKDDDVDALVAAIDYLVALGSGGGGYGKLLHGRRRM